MSRIEGQPVGWIMRGETYRFKLATEFTGETEKLRTVHVLISGEN